MRDEMIALYVIDNKPPDVEAVTEVRDRIRDADDRLRSRR
jgi:methionine synthase II (cobalamin-independent)